MTDDQSPSGRDRNDPDAEPSDVHPAARGSQAEGPAPDSKAMEDLIREAESKAQENVEQQDSSS